MAVVAAVAVLAAGCFIPYDFVDGDGADLVYRDATTGEWFVVGDPTPLYVGTPGADPVPGTYDNDAKWEAAEVVDPLGWVTAGDAGTIDHAPQEPTLVDTTGCSLWVLPVPEDYSGDAATETAWYAAGEWQLAGQAPFVPENSPARFGCAWEGDVPVPADYDGDGKAEAAVHRIGTGRFWIDGEAGPRELPVHLGYPTAGDFDGDGTDEPALLRPDGTLHTETATYPAASPGAFANAIVPVVADHDGDGTDEAAGFDMNDGQWWIEGALVATLDAPDETPVAVRPGLVPHIVDIAWQLECEHAPTAGCPTDATDGDLDGDGTAEITWVDITSDPSATFYQAGSPTPVATFPYDLEPAGGDYDGDGTWDPAVGHPMLGFWATDSAAGEIVLPPAPCPDLPFDDPLGQARIGLVGDWDGDGRDEPGTYCRSDATWHLPGHTPVAFGEPATGTSVFDLPVPGDYDGDGDDEPGLYRPRDGSWWALGQPGPVAEHLSLGLPMPADVDGDGDDDPQVASIATDGQWQGATGPREPGPGGSAPASAPAPLPAPLDVDGDGAAQRAALYFLPGASTTGEVWHEVEGATPVQVATASDGLPGTWTAMPMLHLIWMAFTENECTRGDTDSCPRPFVDGDLDGDGLGDPAWVRSDGDAGTWTWHVAPDPTPLATAPDSAVPVTADYDGDGRWEPAWVDLATGTWTTTGRQGTIVLPPPTCGAVPLLGDGVLPVVGDFDHDTLDEPAWYCVATGTWHFDDGTTLALGDPYPTSPAWAAGGTHPDEYYDLPLVVSDPIEGDLPALYSPVDGAIITSGDGGLTNVGTVSPLGLAFGGATPGVHRFIAYQMERVGQTDWVFPFSSGTSAWLPGPVDLDGDGTPEAAAVGSDSGAPSYLVEGQTSIPLGFSSSEVTEFDAFPVTMSAATLFDIIRATFLERDCYDNAVCPPGFTWPGHVPPPSP